MIAQSYIIDVPVVVSFMHHNVPRGMLQQDNERPHTTRATLLFLNQNGVDVLNWPSSSPDLSPVEHLWDGKYTNGTHHQEMCKSYDKWGNMP